SKNTIMRSFLLFLTTANAKIFERCEWACTLRANGIDGYYGVLADWVCLTQWESNYNTMAKNTNRTDFGIFQINSYLCGNCTLFTNYRMTTLKTLCATLGIEMFVSVFYWPSSLKTTSGLCSFLFVLKFTALPRLL
uniref:lysozyme n=1 Tax=Oreochromis aureus TaxID=47969 RepID=A0AAZ1Y483_OREAU